MSGVLTGVHFELVRRHCGTELRILLILDGKNAYRSNKIISKQLLQHSREREETVLSEELAFGLRGLCPYIIDYLLLHESMEDL